MISIIRLFVLSALVILNLPPASALAATQAEVMSISGKATHTSKGVSRPVSQGDMIAIGDRIDVPDGSSVDIAYDKSWENVTRLSGPTKIQVLSIHPTGLSMDKGDIFAQLKKLPKNSTFEIQTPAGIAAVRGSALRTTHDDQSGTHVYNFSESPVEVFEIDREGNIVGEPEVLGIFEKSSVGEDGPPTPARPMTDEEKNVGTTAQSGLREEIKTAFETGRESQLEPVEIIEKKYETAFENRIENRVENQFTLENKDRGEGPKGNDRPLETERMMPKLDGIIKQAERSVEKIERSQERQDHKPAAPDGTTPPEGSTGHYNTGNT